MGNKGAFDIVVFLCDRVQHCGQMHPNVPGLGLMLPASICSLKMISRTTSSSKEKTWVVRKDL